MTCHLLPFEIDAGPVNMAKDETLLESAFHQDAPCLRFYAWSTATVSLGYFQSMAVRDQMPALAGLPWVRRPSGGAMLVHHHEVTYCLALPPRLVDRPDAWMTRTHRVIHEALDMLGVGNVSAASDTHLATGESLCFQQFTKGDLLCGGGKVVGSAQRKHRLALMQHGAILLAQSPFTPMLPGIREQFGIQLDRQALCETICKALSAAMRWAIMPRNWTEDECSMVETLRHEKYAATIWNEKR